MAFQEFAVLQSPNRPSNIPIFWDKRRTNYLKLINIIVWWPIGVSHPPLKNPGSTSVRLPRKLYCTLYKQWLKYGFLGEPSIKFCISLKIPDTNLTRTDMTYSSNHRASKRKGPSTVMWNMYIFLPSKQFFSAHLPNGQASRQTELTSWEILFVSSASITNILAASCKKNRKPVRP